MAEHVVEDVRLLEIIELRARRMKLPAGKRRLLRCSKKTSSGTRPGTATTVQPVRAYSRSFSSSKSGMPGRDRLKHLQALLERLDRAVGSAFCWRANSVSQTQWSSAVSSSQCCGTVQSAAAPGGGIGEAERAVPFGAEWLRWLLAPSGSFQTKRNPARRAGRGSDCCSY